VNDYIITITSSVSVCIVYIVGC